MRVEASFFNQFAAWLVCLIVMLFISFLKLEHVIILVVI
jgi:hypothetical protein